MLSDVLEFTSNATHMQQVCNKDIDMYRTFFSGNTGKCPFFLYTYTIKPPALRVVPHPALALGNKTSHAIISVGPKLHYI